MSKAKLQQAEIGQGTVMMHIREGYWNSLQSFCQDYYKRTSDPLYIFWKAFATYNLGNVNDAINDLLSIQQKKQISYACIVGLLFYQNQARNIDREQIDNLRSRERDERRNGADKAIAQAIYFFCFVGQFRKAQDLLQQKGKVSILFQIADVWYNIYNVEEQNKQKLEKDIDRLYQQKDKSMPRIMLFLSRQIIKSNNKKFDDALQTLNEGIVYYPTFIPFMTEKITCLMSLSEWQEFQQAALEVSQRDSSNIKATVALAFYDIAREGSIDNGFIKIKELQQIIQKKEGRNAKLLYQNAHLFLRICGRNSRIVELLQRIIDKCRKYDPLNADYVIQQGNQFLMLGKIQQAYRSFQQASSLDESKLQSITGMIQCKLLQQQIDDAENQIQFVNVMQQTIGRTPTIAYLEAMLTIRKPNQTNQSMIDFYKILDGALKLQIAYSKTLNYGFSYYSKLNPNFLFSIAELYLSPISMKEMIEGSENPNPTSPIGKGLKLLESITRQIPGFLPAYLLLAKGKLAIGNDMDASVAIAKVLDIDGRNEEGAIISAMIRNKKKDYQAALNSLQEAIAINFKIRQNPLFMLIKGEIEYTMGDYYTAQETMLQAAALPAVRKRINPNNKDNKKFKILTYTQKDRCSIFLQLAKCHMKTKKNKESKTVMTQAISQFAGTTQQVHVLLTNAFIAVETGDIKKAMSILKQVKSDSTYFVESRKLLADVHLKYLKSRKGYAKCYYEIIEAAPTFQNFKIYGDALIKINEPQEASVAYQKAYQQKSDNEVIIRDLGRSYALAHDYEKATKFYEDNIEKLNRPDLIIDLAKLCTQLKKFDRAEELLQDETFSSEDGSYEKLKQNVEANYQLYKLNLKRQGKYDLSSNEKARKHMKSAIQLQKLVIERLRQEGGSAEEEKLYYADLYFQLAKYINEYEKNSETSILMLNQCLKINEEHEKGLELLCQLQLIQGNTDQSQKICKVLLQVNPKNDQAGVILSQILLKNNEYDKAIDQFRKILDEEPDKYAVLAKLIDFFRRNNELSQAKHYIQNAQNRASNSNDAGLCYCRGLYHKYLRNPSEALIEFNKAKKSAQYAENALTHMIDIFICPDQDYYYSSLEARTKPVHPENIRICESLLREMRNRSSNHRYVVMEAYVTMLSGKVKNIDDIIKKLVEVLTNRSQYPPAMFALAIAKFIAGKDVEGNNFLKLCSKMTYTPECGEELEKAWLLHAQSYIQIKKFDNAEDILRMLLKENKSCGKAEELMGLIRQKQQAYADASEFYDKAFSLTSRKSAAIGYRLAYNYLKAKRYIDCLQICRQVTEAHPGYTNIKVDIQEKAIMAIR